MDDAGEVTRVGDIAFELACAADTSNEAISAPDRPWRFILSFDGNRRTAAFPRQ